MKENNTKKNMIKRISIISVSCLLGLGFIGNVCYAIFSGGEFAQNEEKQEKTPGMLRLQKGDYISSYFADDTFRFNKENSTVSLVCKDPLIENLVKIDSLPKEEYGFKVSHYQDEKGKTISKKEASEKDKADYKEVFSDFCLNAEDVKLDKDVIDVYLVSKRYQSLMTSLNATVLSGHINEDKAVSNLVLEAEEASVYMDDTLLSKDDLASKPDSAKPFLSNKGSDPISDEVASLLSNKACLRNFQSYNMKVEFTVLALKDMNADLTINYCNRKESKTFDSYFKVLVNNDSYDEINSQKTVKGTDFFTPCSLSPVSISLHKGINRITFESGSQLNRINPVNLDGISLKTSEMALAGSDAIIMEE